MTDEVARPLLRVVRGDATAEEIAALVAVVTARLATAGDSTLPPSQFAAPVAAHRTALPVGVGAWIASGWVPGTRTSAAW
jgi:hypothetical protein